MTTTKYEQCVKDTCYSERRMPVRRTICDHRSKGALRCAGQQLKSAHFTQLHNAHAH